MTDDKPTTPTPTPPTNKPSNIPMTGAARTLLTRKGIDPTTVTATGRMGKITREDALAHIQNMKPKGSK